MTTSTRHPVRRIPFLVTALTAATLLVAACGGSGGLGTVPPPPASPTPAPTPDASDETPSGDPGSSPSPSPTGAPGSSAPSPSSGPSAGPTGSPTVETIVIRTYGVLPGDPGVEGLVATLQTIPETDGVARAALEQLLAGKLDDGVGSAIPSGVRLLGVSIRDGVATVDLSREFEGGGGSASIRYRLGQVVYTLTQFSSVRSVLFQIEGETVSTFSAEGIVLDGPQTRADYRDLLPSMFVDRPAYGAAIGNPAKVSGLANVFEATFRVAILDHDGEVIADEMVMADCGTGCWGEFSTTVEYDVDKAQWGTLRVYFGSAQDGSPQDIRDYPVWLTPAG